MKIGILALQGDYEAHGQVLEHLNVEYLYIRKPEHLLSVKGLILPGGESTAMLNFLVENDFFEAIKSFATQGHFLFGTCAGAILLGKEVISPSQSSLGLLDVTIERNAFGRQLSSHIGRGNFLGKENDLDMIFIRAPRLLRVGKDVKVFATYQNQPVGVVQNNLMATTFHPELTQDYRIHQMFIDMVQK